MGDIGAHHVGIYSLARRNEASKGAASGYADFIIEHWEEIKTIMEGSDEIDDG
jgi:hypothetical protein